jgi:hypothetical protein
LSYGCAREWGMWLIKTWSQPGAIFIKLWKVSIAFIARNHLFFLLM